MIWSNIICDSEREIDDIRSEYPGLSDAELYEKLIERNCDYLEDIRIELDIPLSRPILMIADIGRWNGRFNGYKEISSGNVRDCFCSDTDLVEWYLDQYGDLRADAIHHDGTNYYLYRVYKDEATDEQKDKLKYKIVSGTATWTDIEEVTDRLGDRIAEVYGFTDSIYQKKEKEKKA